MLENSLKSKLKELFIESLDIEKNYIVLERATERKNQNQTNDVFSEKWEFVKADKNIDQLGSFQKEWFLKLYGFESEEHLARTLSEQNYIFDAGCGLGYKSAWFADLAPNSIVIGMDYSDAAKIAADKYKNIENLFFIQGDIAKTNFKNGVLDFVVCDQVIMHTEDPEQTFNHLSSITKDDGQFCCYVYRKKALPRELVDSYFREKVHNISKDEIWELSKQLTVLGKRLSELNVSINSPEIPLLGIKEGEYDIQRFIYWNFLKCFWKPEWSEDLNVSTNFDWYSPSNARRFSKEEFIAMIDQNMLNILSFHEEEACYSGRFAKK